MVLGDPMKHNLSTLLMIQFILIPLLSSPVLSGDRFIDNGNGTVTDNHLKVMWAATDNIGDINWHQADKWVRYTLPTSLPVLYDNWRLPTLQELKSLYIKDKAYQGYESECGKKIRITPEIRLTCSFVWSGDRQSVTAQVFNFNRGTFYSDRLVHNRGYRALAVRDLK